MPLRCRPSRWFRLSSCAWSAVLVGLTMFFLTVAEPAMAHSELVTVSPADGSVLTAPPREVVLTFSEAVQTTGTSVVVVGPDDVQVSRPDSLVVAGPQVSIGLNDLSAAGDYQVEYRVVSADGHVVTGTTSYSIEGGGASSSPTPSPVASAAASEPAAASPSSGTAGSFPAWYVLAGVLAVAVAALGFVVLLGRRARG